MKSVINTTKTPCLSWRFACLLAVALLASCTTESSNDSTNSNSSASGDFSLIVAIGSTPMVLVEGDEAGLRIPVSLQRKKGNSSSIELSIDGVNEGDNENISSSFSNTTLTQNTNNSELALKLAIGDLPILPQQRKFVITASSGADRATQVITVDVQPVEAPDVYLLVGQSNMVGFSGEGTREAFTGGADESNPRILQLNVSKNDSNAVFISAADFTSPSKNVISPSIVIAEDPLHIPLELPTSGKSSSYIGMGLSFAKRALTETTQNIILVPAAWSGSAFCANSNGPNGQWNALPTPNANLGNTWLFDRAITRVNLALQLTGGILRGILWHQGESDSNDACAESYQQNLDLLIQQMRLNIDADRRGAALRQSDSNIPFIVGTMSRGSDNRDDLSQFSASKQLIDNAHRTLPTRIPFTGVSNNDDLTPANGYPCGNGTCIHFGAAALREMGQRYYEALVRAVVSRP